ncbi:MAG: hypothetical protein LBF58_07995 [Deltaproteobacteria bacterium]|jgi:hypothetical protein|nr:hypothetical protein [Deltaproteobacteria bacterium]
MLQIERTFQKIKEPILDGSLYTVPEYIVGSNQLLFFYDGLLCALGEENQYTEMGEIGKPSTTIKVHFTLSEANEVIIIVIKHS